MVKRDGRVLASKDFPKDEVIWQDFEPFIQVSQCKTADLSVRVFDIDARVVVYFAHVRARSRLQVGMETSDASELVAQKVRAKYHKVNFNFRVTHFDRPDRPADQHAVTNFDREKAYG
jgi:hypothetical protein